MRTHLDITNEKRTIAGCEVITSVWTHTMEGVVQLTADTRCPYKGCGREVEVTRGDGDNSRAIADVTGKLDLHMSSCSRRHATQGK